MSVHYMSAVLDLELPRDKKLVLMVFADHANDEGYCWPSVGRIAWRCGYAQRKSVRRIVRELMRAGLLSKIEEGRGSRPPLWQVRPHAGKKLSEYDPAMFLDDRSGAEKDPKHGAEKDPQTEGVEGDDSGAEKDPIGESGASNPLTVGRNSQAENGHGAEKDPQTNTGAEKDPQRKFVGQSRTPRGVISDPLGGAWSAPQTVMNRHEPLAPSATTSRSPPARSEPPPSVDPKIRLMNNSARNLGIHPMTPSETVESFETRIAEAHKRVLDAQVERRRSEDAKRAGEAEEAASG